MATEDGTRSVWRVEIMTGNMQETGETVSDLEQLIRDGLKGLQLLNVHIMEIEDMEGFWEHSQATAYRERMTP